MVYVNEVYRYVLSDEINKCIRIIDIQSEIDRIYYVVLDTNFAVPNTYSIERFLDEIKQHVVIKIPDPYLRRIDEDSLSDKEKDKRDTAWALADKYWRDSKEELLLSNKRTKLFSKIAKENNLSDVKVRRIFTRFFQRGMNKNAMLPDYINSGGKGKAKKLTNSKIGRPKKPDYEGNEIIGINITPEIKDIFNLGLERYYRTKSQQSIKEVYTTILKEFFSDSYKENGEIKYRIWDKDRIPSYNQFYYWVKKLEKPTKDIIERQGMKEYQLEHRPILSNSTIETVGPGTRFQVDATVADIYLVSKLDRHRIIGRPIVYAIIDVYSRLVTGIYVGLEGPSWIGAMMALDNMVENKVAFCKEYGIEIEEHQWPAKHLPQIILADRGEFEGYSVENLINNLGIVIENTPPYRGDLKGIVERKFRTINTKLKHKTPGAIMKEFRQRGDRDYRLDATLTLEEFTKIIIQLVIHHNNNPIEKYPMEKEMLIDGLLPIPSVLWQWGMENKKGSLRTIEREIMRLNVLPKAKASVSRAGIKFKNLAYGSQKSIQEQWFVNQKVRCIEIVYDPRNINNIYIPETGGKAYETCYLLEGYEQYKNIVLEELIFMQELQSELMEKQRQEQLQKSIHLEQAIEDIVKQAQKEKYNSVNLIEQSKTKKLKSIKKNREVEKELNRIDEAFKLDETQYKQSAIVTEIKPSQAYETENLLNELTPKQKLINRLKQKRDEKRGKG